MKFPQDFGAPLQMLVLIITHIVWPRNSNIILNIKDLMDTYSTKFIQKTKTFLLKMS